MDTRTEFLKCNRETGDKGYNVLLNANVLVIIFEANTFHINRQNISFQEA